MSGAPQQHEKRVSESRIVSVDMSGKLDVGEILVGVPTVAEVNTSDLAFSNQSVNTGVLVINDNSVPVGQAIRFLVTGGLAKRKYTITVTCTTNSGPAQTVGEAIVLRCVADSAT